MLKGFVQNELVHSGAMLQLVRKTMPPPFESFFSHEILIVLFWLAEVLWCWTVQNHAVHLCEVVDCIVFHTVYIHVVLAWIVFCLCQIALYFTLSVFMLC